MNKQGRPAGSRYTGLSIGAHWLTLALLVGVYACIELREFYPRGSGTRQALATWHYMLGLATFALVFLRLVFRIAGRTPPIDPAPPLWQQRLAGLMHLALYAFLVAMPLLGWFILSTANEPVPFFGMQLPPLAAPDRALSHSLEEIHETIGTAGAALLKKAEQVGADLIVLGAFAHSRMRERAIGCATRYVLEHAQIPIFLQH